MPDLALTTDNGAYGFLNGAQTDLFATVGGAKLGDPQPDSASVAVHVAVESPGSADSSSNPVAIASPAPDVASAPASAAPEAPTSISPVGVASASGQALSSAIASPAPPSGSSSSSSNQSSASSASVQRLSTTATKAQDKICQRRRNTKRAPTSAQIVGYPHERVIKRSGKNASAHVIAQRRWEQDRANRALMKRSLGAGVF